MRRTTTCWTIVAVFTGSEPVRAEPFDAVDLDIAGLWVETAAP